MGPYTLLAKIGEGGMGVVHLARRGDDGARVALKVLRQHIVGDEEARQRLAREVASLGRIRSRWVAEILDADPWADIPYVATRYVPGLSLHDHVAEEGAVEGDDLLWFAGALAEGLTSVHAAGVLHRDVKPSNVLMEGRTPILIDFGLARVADDPRLTHTGWLLGTPGYLAPEILYGDDATPASDLHSWAATVAFAGTGAAPFGRGPSMAIMDRVRRGEHDLTGLTGALHDVVAAALDPEPERRPTLPEVLDWLRPQTTRPAPLLAPPPRLRPTAPRPAPAAADPFVDSLALAAQAHAPALAHAERSTLMLPTDAALAVREPVAGPPPAPSSAPPPPHLPPPLALAPTPPTPLPTSERVRRAVLVGAGCLLTGAAVVAAPWVALAAVVLVVWLLRSASLAASAAGARRWQRGRRWYDAPQLLLSAPWHLARAIPGAVVLLLWAAGLAVAAALVCYAVGTSVPLALVVTGLTLAPALWWGPGAGRLRGPLGRVVHPVSHRVWPWLAATAAVLALAVGCGLYAESRGPSWTPGRDHPFATR